MLTRDVRSAARTRLPRARPGLRALTTLCAFAWLLCLSGCASSERYVWAQSLPPQPAALEAPSYVIGAGDLLDVRVYNEERLSAKSRVRTDGRITLPLVGDIEARGKTPSGLAAELQLRLQQWIKDPTVTVGVDEVHPLRVVVLGEVKAPGVFQLPQRATVIAALALAGGFTENADQDSIFLVRRQPAVRVRFSYRTLTSADAGAVAAFPLQDGDVVTVE
jgi:polysaccharide export outer membrane protein